MDSLPILDFVHIAYIRLIAPNERPLEQQSDLLQFGRNYSADMRQIIYGLIVEEYPTFFKLVKQEIKGNAKNMKEE